MLFLTVIGGGHGTPSGAAADRPAAQVVAAATIDFFDTRLVVRPDELDRLCADTDRPGVTRLESALG